MQVRFDALNKGGAIRVDGYRVGFLRKAGGRRVSAVFQVDGHLQQAHIWDTAYLAKWDIESALAAAGGDPARALEMIR